MYDSRKMGFHLGNVPCEILRMGKSMQRVDELLPDIGR